jgi:hypothetical protein
MLGSRPLWVQPAIEPDDQTFDGCALKSIAAWHDRLGLTP